MLWAAMTLCFYGFLWAREVIVPSKTEFDPSQHLTYEDIAVDNKRQPSFITVNYVNINNQKQIHLGKG